MKYINYKRDELLKMDNTRFHYRPVGKTGVRRPKQRRPDKEQGQCPGGQSLLVQKVKKKG
jgi:hypothetical protein